MLRMNILGTKKIKSVFIYVFIFTENFNSENLNGQIDSFHNPANPFIFYDSRFYYISVKYDTMKLVL